MNKKIEKQGLLFLIILIMGLGFLGCSKKNQDKQVGEINQIEMQKKQLLVKQSRYDDSGQLFNWSEFEYDDEGNKISEKVYDESGKLYMEKRFNASGKEVEWVSYGEDGAESTKRISVYDKKDRILVEDYYFDGEAGSHKEYTYTESETGEVRTYYYHEDGEKYLVIVAKFTCDAKGNILTSYEYFPDDNGDIDCEEYTYEECIYNLNGDCIQEIVYFADKDLGGKGELYSTNQYLYEYDFNGNLIEYKSYDARTGEKGAASDDWRTYVYDEARNEIEITYYNQEGMVKGHNKYVNEYKDTEIFNSTDMENTIGSEKEVESVKEQKKFMKELQTYMEKGKYESINDFLTKNRNTMWNTIYYQNGEIVDTLSDGKALIYSWYSGIYYGDIVDGKRCGHGVQWREDWKSGCEEGDQEYYYIDGEWSENRGNGYCKVYYSQLTGRSDSECGYFEGTYVDSLEDGEMKVYVLMSDNKFYSGSYMAINGNLKSIGEGKDGKGEPFVKIEGIDGIMTLYGNLENNGFERISYSEENSEYPEDKF